MLHIIRNSRAMDFSQLMNVYEDSNRLWAQEHYPYLSESEQQLRTEQDMYGNLQCFLLDRRAFYALWEQDGVYVSAVRFEPYEDGLLLEALETAPAARGKGYATALVRAALSQMTEKCPVYAHIQRNNTASVKVHRACGFEKLYDHAIFVDGSVSQRYYTFIYNK